MVNIFYEDTDFNYGNASELNKWIKKCVEEYKKGLGETNIIFCSDQYLYEMNKHYLNHDYYTDVITFPYNSPTTISGDIFISIDRVKENAEIYKTTFDQELHRVIIHGILHLLGFDDKNDEEKKIMREKENICLSKMNSNEITL